MTDRSILIVEDDDDIRMNLRDLLEDEGYAVQTAQNGQVALDLLEGRAELPRLILLDLMMPVKDGAAFREAQRADPRLAAIPVVIMSAAAEIRAKSERLGVPDYLCKPLDLTALLGAVERYTA